jgi:RHS repeat-associated protein
MTSLLAETRWFKNDSQKVACVYTRATRSKKACSSKRSTNSKQQRHLRLINSADNYIASERLQVTYPGTGNNSQFTYDGLGHDVKILEYSGGTLSSTKQFVWCGDQMCEARNASSSTTAQYFPLGQTISGSNYYYTKNQPGSIREMTDSSGNVQAEYAYDPYGQVTKLQGSLASDFQYGGYYYHAPSGLNLAVHRAYSSAVGRWISRDPILENGGVNLYSYVNNEPIANIDPSGKFVGLLLYWTLEYGWTFWAYGVGAPLIGIGIGIGISPVGSTDNPANPSTPSKTPCDKPDGVDTSDHNRCKALCGKQVGDDYTRCYNSCLEGLGYRWDPVRKRWWPPYIILPKL